MKRVSNLILGIFLTTSVSAQQVISVTPPAQTPAPSSFFGSFKDILFSPIFWGGIFLLFLILGILWLLTMAILWIIKYIKDRTNVFITLKKERIKIAKVQSRYPVTGWLRITKNTPIRLVRKEDGRIKISAPIGYHCGDYATHEGNYVIAMNLVGMKKFWWLPFYPETDLLVIPNKDYLKINKVEMKNMPSAKDIINFNSGEILIYADSLSKCGEFYLPVVTSKDGKIVDLSLPVYQSLKDVALSQYLYEQTDSFGKLAKKGMDINPSVRAINKTIDNSQSVEIPEGENK